MADSNDYQPGDLVWAKMKGYPAWPARVATPRKNMKNPPRKNMFCIFFYGTHNFAWIDDKDIKPYAKYKEDLGKLSKIATFKAGIAEIDNYIQKKETDPNYEDKEFEEDEEDEEDTPATSDEDFDKLKNSSLESFKEPKGPKKPPKQPKVKRASPTRPPSAKRRRKASSEDNESSVYASPRSSSNHVLPTYRSILDKKAVMEILETPQVDIGEVSENLKNKKITASTNKFGFLGLGVMGSEIVKNLIYSGHQINLWNRSKDKADNIKDQADQTSPGLVQTFLTPADVVANSDIIFCCVSDPSAVKQIIHGNCGVISEKNSLVGKGYVEMSNIDDKTSMDMAELITDNGGRYLEAQLQGSKEEAHNGTLIILGAGDRSLFKECDSCLKAIGRTVFFLGEVGFATKLNLVLQVMRGISLAGLAEGFALANHCGLSLKDVLDVFNKTNMSSPFLNGKAQMMINGDFTTVHQSMRNMQKDLCLSLQMADVLKQPMSMTATANTVYTHVLREGFALHDSSAIFSGHRH